jgi:S1-C subfamily serine protease
VVADVVSSLLSADVRPQFVRAKTAPSRRAGSGPYLGITPDFTPSPKGVRIGEVAAGSPAESAGLQAGDLVVSMDASPIGDTFDLTYALSGRKAGDVVRIKLLRDGKHVTSEVKLAARAQS